MAAIKKDQFKGVMPAIKKNQSKGVMGGDKTDLTTFLHDILTVTEGLAKDLRADINAFQARAASPETLTLTEALVKNLRADINVYHVRVATAVLGHTKV